MLTSVSRYISLVLGTLELLHTDGWFVGSVATLAGITEGHCQPAYTTT